MTTEKSSQPSNSEVLVYRLDEAARLLTISTRTIRKLIRAGQLVGRRIGTRVVIPRTSLEAFPRRDHATGNEGRQRGSAKGTRRGAGHAVPGHEPEGI